MKATVKASALGAALLNVLPHASTDKTVPVLNGLRLRVEGDTLTIDATDRYTLAEQTLALAGESVDGAAIVPTSFVKEIVKACKPVGYARPDVTVSVDGDRITVEHVSGSLASVLLPGSFPNAENLWPKDDVLVAVEVVGFSPANVAKFLKLHSDSMSLLKNAAAVFSFRGSRPATVAVGALPDFRALVMPVKL